MVRLCVWSGPRNVSTALLRSFEARGDCLPVDEPLYAAFLAATGKEHPGRAQILASQPTDPQAALAALQARAGDRPYAAEKHMAHHWLPTWDRRWFGPARHAFLVREPARVVASYARVRGSPLPEDLGYQATADWFEHVAQQTGRAPVVVDGDALVRSPAAVLPQLCAGLGVPYTDAMLRWPPGRRATDGVWAPHWYAAVEASTGFAPPSPPAPVPAELAWLVDAVAAPWEHLRRHLATPG